MATYLVTGGAGFIGSNIVDRLVRDGEKVRVVDNLSTGRMENIRGFLKDIDLIEGSVTDAALLNKALNGVDYVLHQAAIPSVARSVEDPLRSNDANVCGTLSLLVAAKGSKIKGIVFASSSSVYGNTPTLPKREDMSPDPLSPYAVTKYACECYIRVFANLYGINAVSLRYFNVFGPRQNPGSDYAAVIPKFISLILKGEKPVIYGDGSQSRDFTFVENVVNANLLACRNFGGRRGDVMNVACGARYTLIDLVNTINELAGKSVEPVFSAGRPGEVKHSLADISLAGKSIGYEPRISFKEGLKRTVEWFKAGNER